MAASESFDALVVGAGVGGVAAAVRLTQQGYRTVVVEAEDRAGGRAASREHDGFVLNSGALALERDGAVAELYGDLGESLDLHVPRHDTVLLIGGRALPASTGPIDWSRTIAPHVLRWLTRTVPRLRPRPGQSTTAWLHHFTSNRAVHGIVHNICGAFFAASGEDLPADVFLSYMSQGSGFKRIGFVPGGTGEAWKPLLDHVVAAGGEVWFDSRVRELHHEGGLVTGAEIDRSGTTVHVEAGVVVSNVGPEHTIALVAPGALPVGYAEAVEASTNGSAIITIHVASPVPLATWSGVGLAGRSRRMTYLQNLSDRQQRQAKPGWHLYAAASTPRPATGAFDVEAEKELLLADIRDHLPGFAQHGVVLRVDVVAHDQPAQRAISGYDLPVETPLANLWNVGDGVKPWGQAGTAACVRSAEKAVDAIVRRSARGIRQAVDHPVRGVDGRCRSDRSRARHGIGTSA